jgi:hypothetical protein
MKPSPILEQFIYVLLIVISLAALWLVANAPVTFLDSQVVYQGF